MKQILQLDCVVIALLTVLVIFMVSSRSIAREVALKNFDGIRVSVH